MFENNTGTSLPNNVFPAVAWLRVLMFLFTFSLYHLLTSFDDSILWAAIICGVADNSNLIRVFLFFVSILSVSINDHLLFIYFNFWPVSMGVSFWIFKREIKCSWNLRPNGKCVIGTVVYWGVFRCNICNSLAVIKFFKVV